MRKPYYKNCVSWPIDRVDELEFLIGNREDIGFDQFRARVSISGLKDLAIEMGYKSASAIGEDYHVKFYECPKTLIPFMVHSAVEYVFADIQQIRKLGELTAAARDIEPVWDWIDTIADAEEDENFELHIHDPQARPQIGADWVLIVHPGDAVDELNIMDRLEDMKAEIENLIETGRQVVFLHRNSSQQMREPKLWSEHSEWFDFCSVIIPDSIHFYSDQLEMAAQHLGTLHPGHITVTGLWAEPETGCVPAIAHALRSLGHNAIESPLAIHPDWRVEPKSKIHREAENTNEPS